MPEWADDVRARLASLRLSPTREAEIVEELSQHLDDRYQELIAGGASPDEARRAALGDFRSSAALAQHLAPLRQARTPPPITPGATSGHVLGDLWQDVGYAVRMFVRQRGFAAAAILTLALGIGANSAIFTVVRAVLMEALPFRDAERLYRLRMIYPDGSAYATFSAPDFMSLRESTRAFEQLDAYTSGTVTMLGGGEPREVRVTSVSDGLFDLLGLRVGVGRGFTAGEHAPAAERRRDARSRLLAAHVRRPRRRPRPIDHYRRHPLHHRRRAGARRATARGCAGCTRAERGGRLPAHRIRRGLQRNRGRRAALEFSRGARESEARRDGYAARRRPAPRGARAADRLSEDERGPDDERDLGARADRRRRAQAAAHAARRGRIRAAWRVRERRESDARADLGAA